VIATPVALVPTGAEPCRVAVATSKMTARPDRLRNFVAYAVEPSGVNATLTSGSAPGAHRRNCPPSASSRYAQ
jgi:hypothetical protein